LEAGYANPPAPAVPVVVDYYYADPCVGNGSAPS